MASRRPRLTVVEGCEPATVAAGRVGAVGEQRADAGRSSVGRGEAQRVTAEHLVGVVDGGAGGDEVIDDVEALVVGCHDQRTQPRLDVVCRR